MNKRALKKLLAANDEKSPDILTAIIHARNNLEAYAIAGTFEEVAKEELPFQLDQWQRTIRSFPVELYFVFKQKKALLRFTMRIRREFPDIQIVT